MQSPCFRCFHNDPGRGQPAANVKHFLTCPINKIQQQRVGYKSPSEQQQASIDIVRGFVNANNLNASTDAAPVPQQTPKLKTAILQSRRTYKNKQPLAAKEFEWTAYYRGSAAELRETAQRTLTNQRNQRYHQKQQQPVPVFPETQSKSNKWEPEEDWEDDLTFTLHKCSLGTQTDNDMSQGNLRKRSLSTQTDETVQTGSSSILTTTVERKVISPINFPGQENMETPAKRRIIVSTGDSTFQPLQPAPAAVPTQVDAVVYQPYPIREEVRQRPASPDQSDRSTVTPLTPAGEHQVSRSHTPCVQDFTGSYWETQLPQTSVSNILRNKEHYEMLVSRIARLERELKLAREEQQAVIISVLKEFDTHVGRSEQPDMSV